MLFLLFFFYTVTAQSYSRTYLRSLKQVENERIQSEYIYIGITRIQDTLFAAAKQGLLNVTIPPLPECKEYILNEFPPVTVQAYSADDDRRELFTMPFVDKEVCKNIINGIHELVYQIFSDCQVIYYNRRFMIKWD